MPNYSRTIIIGHLGRDPEIRYTADGSPVAGFSVAVTKKWNQDGEKKEQTSWFRCSVFKKQAEIAEQYLHKGDAVLVEGEMLERSYTDKEGNEKRVWELRGDRITLMGKRGGGNEEEDKAADSPPPKQKPTAKPGVSLEDLENDIPF